MSPLYAGLIHAQLLDGQGGARILAPDQLTAFDPAGQTLWLHWDRGYSAARRWLREESGLASFACDCLLEENTRPRLLSLPGEQLLLFLRGVNLNPGASPEDMVSVRIYADAGRVVSLRQRPLKATDELREQLAQGQGPRDSGDLLRRLAEGMTQKNELLIAELVEQMDAEEERLERDERLHLDYPRLQQIKRRAAGLRRFLAPQRDLYAQLARSGLSWLAEQAVAFNELNNRLTRQLEELELLRERVALLLEGEHRRMSHRMNRTMYLLSVVTCFFLPLSFVTGLLGVNLGGMPGSDSPYGFYLACALIGLLAVLQVWLLRRLRWV